MQFARHISEKICEVIKLNVKKLGIIYIHLWCEYSRNDSLLQAKWPLSLPNNDNKQGHTHAHKKKRTARNRKRNQATITNQQVFCLLPNCMASLFLLRVFFLLLFFSSLWLGTKKGKRDKGTNLDYSFSYYFISRVHLANSFASSVSHSFRAITIIVCCFSALAHFYFQITCSRLQNVASAAAVTTTTTAATAATAAATALLLLFRCSCHRSHSQRRNVVAYVEMFMTT